MQTQSFTSSSMIFSCITCKTPDFLSGLIFDISKIFSIQTSFKRLFTETEKNGNLPEMEFFEAFPVFSKIIVNPLNLFFEGFLTFFYQFSRFLGRIPVFFRSNIFEWFTNILTTRSLINQPTLDCLYVLNVYINRYMYYMHIHIYIICK